jgi:hypothetical protein
VEARAASLQGYILYRNHIQNYLAQKKQAQLLSPANLHPDNRDKMRGMDARQKRAAWIEARAEALEYLVPVAILMMDAGAFISRRRALIAIGTGVTATVLVATIGAGTALLDGDLYDHNKNIEVTAEMIDEVLKMYQSDIFARFELLPARTRMPQTLQYKECVQAVCKASSEGRVVITLGEQNLQCGFAGIGPIRPDQYGVFYRTDQGECLAIDYARGLIFVFTRETGEFELIRNTTGSVYALNPEWRDLPLLFGRFGVSDRLHKLTMIPQYLQQGIATMRDIGFDPYPILYPDTGLPAELRLELPYHPDEILLPDAISGLGPEQLRLYLKEIIQKREIGYAQLDTIPCVVDIKHCAGFSTKVLSIFQQLVALREAGSTSGTIIVDAGVNVYVEYAVDISLVQSREEMLSMTREIAYDLAVRTELLTQGMLAYGFNEIIRNIGKPLTPEDVFSNFLSVTVSIQLLCSMTASELIVDELAAKVLEQILLRYGVQAPELHQGLCLPFTSLLGVASLVETAGRYPADRAVCIPIPDLPQSRGFWRAQSTPVSGAYITSIVREIRRFIAREGSNN